MNLGLRRGIVRLSEHNPKWFDAFKSEKALLSKEIGDVVQNIEHVGSTSIEGLPAKPIIDIAATVADLNQIEKWAQRLAPYEYTYFGDRDNRGDHFFAKGPDECRTIYLHVVDHASESMNQYITFRDHLRNNSRAKQEYAKLKKSLALSHGNDRMTYTAKKAKFINEILNKTEQAR